MTRTRFANGPTGSRLFGCSAEFRDQPLELLLRCRREYGRLVELPMGLGQSICLVFDPVDLEEVFKGSQYGRSDLAAMFEPVAGGSMIIADGDVWKRQRKIVAPSFGQERLRALCGMIDEEARELATRWLNAAMRGAPVDLQSELMSYAMLIVTMFMFGRKLTDREVEVIAPAWTESLVHISRRLAQTVPLPMWVPLTTHRRLRHCAGVISGTLLGVVRERRDGRGTYLTEGFLGHLLAHRDEETGRGLSDEEIVREMMGTFLAGFDTVASGMMWTYHYMSRHPQWQERVREEMAAVPDSSIQRFDLSDCPMLDQVYSESVRLMPPLWLVDRKNNEPVTLSGHQIPSGTNIITSPYVTHRDPAIWDMPYEFRPERFAAGNGEQRHKFAYFPYGGGRMKCIGIALGMLEIKAIMRHTLPLLRFEPLDEVVLSPVFGLRTTNGLRVTVKPTGVAQRAHVPVAAAAALQ